MSDEGRSIGSIVNLSRQRQQSLVYIVQEGRQLDVNAISQAGVLILRAVPRLHRGHSEKPFALCRSEFFRSRYKNLKSLRVNSATRNAP